MLRSTVVSKAWIPRLTSIQGLDTKTTKREYSRLVSKVQSPLRLGIQNPSDPVVRGPGTPCMAATGLPRGPTLGPGPRAAWCPTSEQGAALAAHICSVQGVAQNLSIHGYCLDTELSGGIQGLDTLDTGELVSIQGLVTEAGPASKAWILRVC